MAKFPDPTRDYKAEPISAPIDLSAMPDPTASQPPDSPNPTTSTLAGSSSPAPEPAPISSSPAEQTPPTSPELAQEQAEPDPFPATTTPSPQKVTPTKPKIQHSPFRNLIPLLLGGGVFVIMAMLALQFIPQLLSPKVTEVTLNYWGLWEPSSVMQGVIADYESQNPNVKVVYTMQSPKNYRSRLQSAIDQGSGPDIARIHNTWLPILGKSLQPAPESVVPQETLNDYYPVVSHDLVANGQVYALPLMIDGLALYYNQDMLEEAGASPPSDWNSLRKLAFDLTIRNASTNIIERSGLAMGTTNNIDHWSDILGLLILQNSGNPAQPDSQAVQDAITFYTTFSSMDKTWDTTQPNDIYAFATKTVAMIIAPSWQAPSIAAINPDLNFKVVPAPTLPETKTAWATYWAEAVPATSKNPIEAWKFISYLSQPEVLQKLYAEQTQIRKIGEVYPLISMSSLLSNDPIAGAFVNQADNYTSWYLSRKTYDEAINDELIKYYEDAINPVIEGTPVSAVINTLSLGVAQILDKYPSAQ